MKIGVDLDGVIFDFSTSFLNYCNIKYGLSNKVEDWTKWDLDECENINLNREMVYSAFDDYNKYRMWQSMDIFPFVKDSLCAIEANGHKIIYITHRMIDSERPTLKSIIKHGLPIHGIHFCETSAEKADICKKMDIPVAIDDKYDTIKAYEEAGITGVLMSARYNRDISYSPTVNNMKEFVALLRNI